MTKYSPERLIMTRYTWTEEEVVYLIDHYKDSYEETATFLGRSVAAVTQKVHKLRKAGWLPGSGVAEAHMWSPEETERVREVALSPGYGVDKLRALVKDLGLEEQVVVRKATNIRKEEGVTRPKPHRQWSEEKQEIFKFLRLNTNMTVKQISKAAGVSECSGHSYLNQLVHEGVVPMVKKPRSSDEKAYIASNPTKTCKELAEKLGRSPSFVWRVRKQVEKEGALKGV